MKGLWIKKISKWFVLYPLPLFIICSCGANNLFDCSKPLSGVPCAERTKDEDARLALDQGDLATAIKLLRELIVEEPTVYGRYPLLAAALAGSSGFDIFNVAKADFGGSGSLLEKMGAFVPTPVSRGALFDSSLLAMNDAVSVLVAVPPELRQDVSGDKFASSCSFQLVLYQSAYSVMLMNKYSYSETGFDPAKLATMSAEDAAAILASLLSAGSIPVGDGGEKTTEAVQKAREQIQSQPGSTDQEKIASYIQANQK